MKFRFPIVSGPAPARQRRAGYLAPIALAVTATVALVACGGGSGSGGPAAKGYRVKVIADLTGPLAAGIGAPSYAGIKAAFDTINAAGGVNGRPIDYSVIDGLSTPAGSQAAARQAVGATPIVIMGATVSSGLAARQQVLAAAKIPEIDTSTDDDLLVKPEPWFYSIIETSRQTTDVLVAGAKQALGGSLTGKTVAIEGIASAGADPIIKGLKKEIEAGGGRVSTTERLNPGAANFTSQAQNIVSSKADALISVDIAANAVTVGEALVTAGFTGPIISSGAGDATSLKAVNAPNFVAQQQVPTPPAGGVLAQAAAKNGATSQLNNLYFSAGWVAAYLAESALEGCAKDCSSADLQKKLDGLGSKSIPGDATYGPIKISATRHYAFTQSQMVKWDPSTGKIVTAGPPIDVPDGEPPLTS
jgi:ABC-type branched-subunit amino acid transport system substrate-binding protein